MNQEANYPVISGFDPAVIKKQCEEAARELNRISREAAKNYSVIEAYGRELTTSIRRYQEEQTRPMMSGAPFVLFRW